MKLPNGFDVTIKTELPTYIRVYTLECQGTSCKLKGSIAPETLSYNADNDILIANNSGVMVYSQDCKLKNMRKIKIADMRTSPDHERIATANRSSKVVTIMNSKSLASVAEVSMPDGRFCRDLRWLEDFVLVVYAGKGEARIALVDPDNKNIIVRALKQGEHWDTLDKINVRGNQLYLSDELWTELPEKSPKTNKAEVPIPPKETFIIVTDPDKFDAADEKSKKLYIYSKKFEGLTKLKRHLLYCVGHFNGPDTPELASNPDPWLSIPKEWRVYNWDKTARKAGVRQTFVPCDYVEEKQGPTTGI